MVTKNSVRRRNFITGIGSGVMLAGAGAILKLTSEKSDSATPQSQNSSKLVTASDVAVKPSGKALPEFQGISQWLNSPSLTTESLKGKVVMIHFWTFGCINCQRTLPYVVRWHEQFAAQGLKVIGVHTPEFAFERDANNVKRALKQHKITYAVPLDNEFKTWNAYSNQYWPHLFLTDRQGFLQYDHIGEGAYDLTEQTIRKLLG
ncbi:MAG: thioredoxin family protein [Rhizonema sp. NSF051]|nr:thioredoxin family protein [Rhizonema sp. NSF051]